MNSTTQETNSHNGACCRLSSQLVPAGYLYQRSSGTGSKYTHTHTRTQTNRQEPIVRNGTTLLEVIDKLHWICSDAPIGSNHSFPVFHMRKVNFTRRDIFILELRIFQKHLNFHKLCHALSMFTLLWYSSSSTVLLI